MLDKYEILKRLDLLAETVKRLPDDAEISGADVEINTNWCNGECAVFMYRGTKMFADNNGLPYELLPSPYEPGEYDGIGTVRDKNGVLLYELVREDKP